MEHQCSALVGGDATDQEEFVAGEFDIEDSDFKTSAYDGSATLVPLIFIIHRLQKT
jgi:hypothetical protein